MIFYHYTCVEHLETIIEAGYLKLCEANVYPPSYFQETDEGIQISSEYLEGVTTGQPPVDENELKGPHVVWLFKKRLTGKGPKMLLSTGTMNVSGSLVPVTIDKSRVEFTVDVPASEVKRADKFFKKHNTPDWWLKVMALAGGNSKVKDWYVIERTIPSNEWKEIKDRYDYRDAVRQGNSQHLTVKKLSNKK